jgi:two-component system LytT family response regulator
MANSVTSTQPPSPHLWRVLIADDEPAARRGVRQLLAPFSEFAVIGESRNGREVLDALDALAPDVLFLDVQMPEMDGFEVIRRRSAARMPAVVFLTAFDQFAIRAFDAEAHDYLVKPVSEVRFAATMDRLTRRLRSADPAAREPSLIVTTARGAVVVPLREVDWIEAADNYARVWANGKSYLLRESLGDLEGRVAVHGFVRAHRQALVRLSGVRGVTSSESGELVANLGCGMRVRVSRRRRASFAAALRALEP